MSNGICAFNDDGVGHNKSGFYLGGCTDPNLASPNCPPLTCGQNFWNDIVYGEDNRWKCCGNDGNGGVMCYPSTSTALNNQTTLDSSTPGQLFLKPPASINARSSAIPLATAISSGNGGAAFATATATVIPPSNGDQNLAMAPGTIAAIVLGVLLVLSCVAVGVVLLRRRKTSYQQATVIPIIPNMTLYEPKAVVAPLTEIDGEERGLPELPVR